MGGDDDDVAGTEKFTDDISLVEFTNAEIDIKFDAGDSTDDLYLDLFKRGDSAWSGNELRWKSRIIIENDGTETEFHYSIPMIFGSGHYRLGMVRSGMTTTFDISVEYRTARSWNYMRES
jgi:hypothetical protein